MVKKKLLPFCQENCVSSVNKPIIKEMWLQVSMTLYFVVHWKEYAEFQYRRRHRQRRRGDMSSLRSNTPDPDDPGDNISGLLHFLTAPYFCFFFCFFLYAFPPANHLLRVVSVCCFPAGLI